MKPSPKLLLALAFTLSAGVRPHAQDPGNGQFQAAVGDLAPASFLIPVVSEPSTWGHQRRITRYATRFEGDHSLEAATVTEEVLARYTIYAVRLQFASGAEQSIVVTAPPGGLQPEMRDMSGDSVANDLVLTSKLLGLPPIVLLNEGHDHLTVAISPGSFASGEDRASGSHQVHRGLALLSSGFKPGELTNCGSLRSPQVQENLLAPISQIFAKPADHTSSSGRAPPAFVARI